MKTIYAVRHGDIAAPKNASGRPLVYPPETPLSEIGINQLQKVGEKLRKDGIDLEVLFSSPFLRAKQSAEILRSILAIPQIIEIPQLRDVDPNSWIGHTIEDYAAIQGDIYSHPQSDKQESLPHLLSRARQALGIIAGSEFHSMGVVSHGDLLSCFDWILKSPDTFPSYLEMKNRFYLQKGQVAEYTIDPNLRLVDEVRLITVDEVNKSLEGYRSLPLK